MSWKKISGAALALSCAAGSLWACGDWFPNRLLPDGGANLLLAPEANFRREIEAMHLVATHHAVISTNGYSDETAAAERAELKQALDAGARSPAETVRILAQFEAQRTLLCQHARLWETWQASHVAWVPNTNNAPPFLTPGAAIIPDGLPGEFADYLKGAIAWHSGATNQARAHWESLLARPTKERHFRSTWAAFMLGKATWESEPGRAAKYFQQVRALAGGGFADSLGLAASSLGWEARVELRRQDYAQAITLYLDQAASGDDSAYNSLRFAAAGALRNRGIALKPLAADPRVQPVITAYIIAGGWSDSPVDVDGVVGEPVARLLERQSFVNPPPRGWHKFDSPTRLWLEAVEGAKVRDVAAAEKLALAAYQSGDMAVAARWIARAPDSAATQWLKSKLLLREGKADEAAALLTKLVRQFPADQVPSNQVEHATFQQRLEMLAVRNNSIPVAIQMLGELGALHLARREYTEALDALLRSGYEADAAYVADRVLTVEEIKNYVDRTWPEPEPRDVTEPGAPDALGGCRSMRDIVGQRLARMGRYAEARAYFAPREQEFLDLFVNSITVGRDSARPATERADALWHGAQAVFQDRFVIQAPAETDWNLSNGNFAYSDTPPARLQNLTNAVLPVTEDEQQRVAKTAVYPDRDWHYRFMAANMAWEAAQLMPDNSDETAHVLWQGGTWIKYADPKAADVFYKALVRRCGKTQLGDAADRRRWFPTLDEQGNIVPFKSRVAVAGTDAGAADESLPSDRPEETDSLDHGAPNANYE